MNKTKKLVLGVDIGGTNIVFGVCNQEGDILFKKKLSMSTISEPIEIISNIYTEIQAFQFKHDIIGIGVGAPNANNKTGCVTNAPNLKWHNTIPLKQLFEDQFKLPTEITNDANAAALGEKIFGSGKDYEDFIEITLGTGVGSGVISNNQLIYGSQSLAGEFGHIRVVNNGRKCGCGRYGCLETYTSATGIVRSIQEMDHSDKQHSILLQLKNPTSKDVVDSAQKGDKFACAIIDFTAEILGNALADFACFSNPKAYILFGGVSNAGEFFTEKVKFHLEKNILNIYKNNIDIITSGLPESKAAILGAASLIYHD